MFDNYNIGDTLTALAVEPNEHYMKINTTIDKDYTISKREKIGKEICYEVEIDDDNILMFDKAYLKHYFKHTPNPSSTASFKTQVHLILTQLEVLLIAKNEKYGNSALKPVRVFSKASATEQILVRLDDKLSRLRTQSIDEDEDVLEDLLGYLVLLKIAIKEKS